MTLDDAVRVYVGGALFTAAACTAMEHAFGETVRLDMRIRATLVWPLFWISFVWAILFSED